MAVKAGALIAAQFISPMVLMQNILTAAIWAETPRRNPMPKKKLDNDLVETHFYIRRKLRMEFKHACERQGTTMQEQVADLMQRFIEYEKESKG